MKTKSKLTTAIIVCLLLCIIIFCGCETTCQKTTLNEKYQGSNVEILTIDSCEYIFIGNDTRSLTHKGNCKFCLERTKIYYTKIIKN